ncbi:MAG: hypothetical protein LUC97_08165 [Clostridiales bacterium]|nr:hypothetical protein [Clostridiales bacterium]MCD8215596.1 hypothetical protein [Clostridiales bacterium]
MKGFEEMPSNNELITNEINNYANLQRLKNAEDIQAELEYQIQLSKAKLESYGIPTTSLDIK